MISGHSLFAVALSFQKTHLSSATLIIYATMNLKIALATLFTASKCSSAFSSSLPLDDAHLDCPLPSSDLGDPSSCKYDSDCGCLSSCGPMDGYTGTTIIHENATHRIWNVTLGPGQSTGMHRHDYDYHFVVKSEAQHAIFGPSGEYIIDFWSKGEIGFIIDGDTLLPTVDFIDIPRVHLAKNIGNTTYNGILYEFKKRTIGQCHKVDTALTLDDSENDSVVLTTTSSAAVFGVSATIGVIVMLSLSSWI